MSSGNDGNAVVGPEEDPRQGRVPPGGRRRSPRSMRWLVEVVEAEWRGLGQGCAVCRQAGLEEVGEQAAGCGHGGRRGLSHDAVVGQEQEGDVAGVEVLA